MNDIHRMHSDSAPVHEHEEEVVEVRGESDRSLVYRFTGLIWLAFGLLEALIGLRVFLKLIAANPGNLFAQFVYALSEPFLIPFFGLTWTPAVEGFVLEIPSIIAMIVYAFIAWAIVSVITLVLPGSSSRRVVTRHHEKI
jgi:hypothetical protein